MRAKHNKRSLVSIHIEAMDAVWGVVKKYDLNWTEILDCIAFINNAYRDLVVRSHAKMMQDDKKRGKEHA
jgi:hypothetical protein